MTVSSKVAYWGEWDSGKTHVTDYYVANGKKVLVYKDYYLIKTWGNGLISGKYDYHKSRIIRSIDDNLKEVHETSFKVDCISKSFTYNKQLFSFYSEDNVKENYIKTIKNNYYFDETLIDKNFWNAKHHYVQLEQYLNNLFDESDLLIAPTPIFGFDRKTVGQIRSLIPPNKYPFDTVSKFKSIRNVVPYKSNIHHRFTNIINIADYSPYKNLQDAYNTYKPHVWKILDNAVAEARAVEILLKQNKIDYEYFNLDNDNYETFFNMPNPLPKVNYTSIDFHVKTNSEKYQFMLNIINEYLDLRKIKDLRLAGAKEDGIE